MPIEVLEWNPLLWEIGMKQEVLEQISVLLAGELDDTKGDLDDLEGQVVQAIRQIGQKALQMKLEGKKRATQAADSPVSADKTPAS
jgi:hypothetical protein